MIYYQLSGYELFDGLEDYLPDQEGTTYFFYVKFTNEQPVEKLKLIFIDLLNAEYNKDGFSNCNPKRVMFHNIVKSNSPMEEIEIDDD